MSEMVNSLSSPVRKHLRLALAMVALSMVVACNYGSNHKTPHAPLNPAMGGAPSESDHTNTDVDDQAGGFGTGSNGAAQDDNVDRSKAAATVPAAKDSTAAAKK
ncbi:MAG: hypothetical protein JST45_13370 [Bacteroidetes bacterium]|nr:hypothetical protein [Bacteroidota bacterium]